MDDRSVFEIVKKYIDEADLLDLFSCGAPANEYDIESEDIANRIEPDYPVEMIAMYIYIVFAYMFDFCIIPAPSDKVYTEMAGKIKNDMEKGYTPQRMPDFDSWLLEEGMKSVTNGNNMRFRRRTRN